ncbi:hypothetical protein NDU88_002665 [Pleurodeles waltl]|uniref:Uncharacterized protein n=1 Tax=Pleurodeles waltl TaxID=8319 RepID=A0AAV7MSC0_PLEWA|nr:hypothetical protein NDU88_002665 [Pleurodeles waltl]
MEEEQIAYLPVDDNFFHIMKTSVYKVVTQLMALLEKNIDLMVSQCSLSLPAEDPAGPSGFSSRGRPGSQEPTGKRAGNNALEAFARLKKACIEHPHNPDSYCDKLIDFPRSLDAELDPEGHVPLHLKTPQWMRSTRMISLTMMIWFTHGRRNGCRHPKCPPMWQASFVNRWIKKSGTACYAINCV